MTSASSATREDATLRPLHHRPGFLALAFLGGALGTGFRYAMTLAVPGAGQGIGITLTINLVGSLILGFFLEALSRRGPDSGRRRQARILLGTGLLGGFTTYSTLTVSAVELMGSGRVGAGIGYALVSVVGGLIVAGVGMACAGRWVPSTRSNEGEAR
ncbi:CrcB family protein [uncultured Kocuria sp.]|uniref:fluoride efflux transporter FluC n=1 Tax=uncultured Kocuria sp. TaxID=259305 RepID=UPI00259572D7|nr:CrcB family protein [uncultured Kocuria sp.]MCT1367080.1 CrcB family protein [Rothia sp. p3-SID1597]